MVPESTPNLEDGGAGAGGKQTTEMHHLISLAK
jgi:hypothetical protein